ncbi:MAG: helix-turn-helix domain-containing protein [Eubacterium sp.]
MNERIKELRKLLGMTQDDFGKKLGLARNSIANYEIGRRIPSNAVITSICREFNINEDWLRYGKGTMKKALTKNQEIGAFANEVMNLPDDAFKKRFIDALKKLDEKDWENLEKIANKLLKED